MGKIKLLSEKTINQIAAGEVVERPSSIVKELIENSIDAGAENIIIEISDGGKKKISVKDDGCGMSEEDVFMALERHATSKISSINDLSTTITMGFRGEAIPSIAAVTHFSIASATTHGEGFKVVSRNGSIIENHPVSMPKGTEITAVNLFHNIPVRKKFLKSEEREFSLIREIILKFSVINYKVAFSFFNDSKKIFSIPASNTLFERISGVWKLKKEMIGFCESANENLSVSAFVPSPAETVPSVSVVSVNGRIVNDRLINAAVYRSFREIIGGEFKSPAMIFVLIEPHFVDINVHPSKLEVRFSNPGTVNDLIQQSIEGAIKSLREDSYSNLIARNSVQLKENVFSNMDLFVSEKKQDNSYSGEEYLKIEENVFGYKFRDYKKIGVVFGVYLIIETADSIVFLDQHASHERITYTALKKASLQKSGLSQMLISPLVVKVSPVEISLLSEFSAFFNDVGFLIENFDDSSIILRAVPALGFDVEWASVIKEMIGQISEYGSSSTIQEQFLSQLAATACKASVKRNDIIADSEIDFLIKDINKSEVLTCPHGRPFFFSISKNEFEKRVERR